MAEPQEVPLSIMITDGPKETNSLEEINVSNQPSIVYPRKKYHRWFTIALYTMLILLGQSAATILGRLYYERGGNSKWMGTLVQLVGFPVLLPYYCIAASKNHTRNNNSIPSKQPSVPMLAFVYVSLGLLVALDCYLYSVGLSYLPVSTYSLISSSQLAFNAFFSFFLNSLKFTPYIINSLVLLTISSTLLVFQTDSSDYADVSKGKYVIGFICTVAASAGYGLVLSLTQVAFKKVIKRETFNVVMDMIIYQSLVATCATLVCLFASGEWKDLTREMDEFEMGKASYILNLSWTAIMWQLFSIGCVGLIFEVSSLFSNAISVLAVPFVPVLAVFFFHDKMHAIKAMSMVLAVWGFISYAYQQYLDDCKSSSENRNNGDVSLASPSEEINR